METEIMNKNELKTKRTCDNIEEKFMQLLQKKSFPKITVQEIIDEAQINRTTFYRHYQDKYELAEKMCGHFLGKFEQCMQERFQSEVLDHESFEQLAAVIQLFYQEFYEESDNLMALFSIHEETIHLYDDMYKMLKDMFYTHYRKRGPGIDMEMDYFSSVYASFVMTSFEWVLKYQPDVDIADYFKKFYFSLHSLIQQERK